jgi:glycosyltransferase involved in cell wall biosynthesis
MKILYDCTVLSKWQSHPTGIQRVVEELGKALLTCIPNFHLVLFDDKSECSEYSIDQNKTGIKLKIEPGDLIFSTGHDWDYIDHFLLLQKHINNGALFGVLFYDIIPIKFPLTYTKDFVSRFEFWFNKTISTVNFAFAISLNTAQDITEFLKFNNLPKLNIHVLRLGDNFKTPINDEPLSCSLSEKISRPYILSVGTVEFRKNHITLLNAYRFLLEDIGYTPPKLYIVGKQGFLDGEIKYQAENDIRLKGLVEVIHGLTDVELSHFYASAMFTVYPSIYEGWGLPVAESFFYGKPCIASKSSSMLEIAPKFTRFAHPLEAEEWANHIKILSENPALLKAESFKIKSEYIKVGWIDTAIQIRELLFQKTLNLDSSL